MYEMSIHPFLDYSIFIYSFHSWCVIKPAVSLEVIVIAPCLPLSCFSKDRMKDRSSIRLIEEGNPRRGSLREHMGFPIRSITADSLKREIGSNCENEFRRVVAVTRSSSLTTSYEGECNGKRDSTSLGYTSRQAIPCCYLA